MKRSDRVTLLRKLGSSLADLEFGEIDLILRQFDLPWSAQWDGDKHSYCTHHIEGASDEILAELHEHLYDGKEFAGVALDEARGPWNDGQFRLFVSHVSVDKVFIGGLKAQLALFGIDAFVAHEDIDPTKEWVHEIEVALATCDALCAFMTRMFHDSRWTDQEIGFCVRRRVLIVPIRAGMDPYGFIARYQGLPGAGRPADELAKALFEVLIGHDLTSALCAKAIVAQFEQSSSFADAKRNALLLQSIRQWNSDLLRRCEEAIERNGQIESAWGVPDSVRALIAQHSQ